MKLKLSLCTGLAMVLLAGCETTRTGGAPLPAGPAEQTIPASAQRVRSAANKIMSERGYQATPSGEDTILFDRSADLGSSAMHGFLYGKEVWRRVRIRMTPDGPAVRLTAEPSLVLNRATQFEKEETDKSDSARKVMHEILARIHSEAQTPLPTP
jgi:hypothetical protein